MKQAYRIDNQGFKEYMKNNSVDLGPAGWDKETGWGLFKLEEKPKIKLPVKEEPKEDKEGENMNNNVKFQDIQGHWAMANIEKVIKKGLMNGYQDGTFKPDDVLTRAELATILVRVLKL